MCPECVLREISDAEVRLVEGIRVSQLEWRHMEKGQNEVNGESGDNGELPEVFWEHMEDMEGAAFECGGGYDDLDTDFFIRDDIHVDYGDEEVVNDGGHLEMCFMNEDEALHATGPLKAGFKAGCRKFVCLDGCFLKDAFKDQILASVGLDGNNGIYPMAWAVVEVENKESWLGLFDC
ncbi:hypothetical protein LIER_06879 [Lithospermum erythrorhizon]|uniref:Uncharacterized protein n=1 Tax=Lithospermum erythrorhizon TaxID=34254 RepID=A0AAV3PAG0_LITER